MREFGFKMKKLNETKKEVFDGIEKRHRELHEAFRKADSSIYDAAIYKLLGLGEDEDENSRILAETAKDLKELLKD